MKPRDYMRKHELSDEAMAERIGFIGAHGIRRLKYHERNPSLPVATKIEEITGGVVTVRDLAKQRHEVVGV